MFGYLINAKWGSSLYNLVHTLIGPTAVILCGLFRMNLGSNLGGAYWI